MNPPHNPPPPRNMASRPPPPSRIPPPHRQQQQHQTTAEVDEAIARRRAELRRLQAKSNAARPLLGTGSTPTGFTPQGRPGQTTPVIAPSARDTPSTAAVARRLDNSYGPHVTQQQQSKPPPARHNISQYQRTSEIFPRSTTGATPVARRTRSSRVAQPPPKAEQSPMLASSSPQVHTKSPFGAARATLVPALPMGDKSVLVPPLMLEPTVRSNEKPPLSKNATQPNKQIEVKKGETKDLKETLSQIVDTASGASTPVTSNSLSTEKTLQRANEALLNAQKDKQGTTENEKKSPPTAAYPYSTASPSIKRSDEKPPQRSKSTPSLMDQLNRAVALKGEKAVMGLLEKLEKPMSSPYNPPLTPRGRSMDLLSSMGAPLTPRSRPSSPERWNNTAPVEKKIRSTPLPKGDKLESNYIIDAAAIISNEYETELVNYIVRAPGCKQKFEYDFFSSEESYRDLFDIDNSDSIEVLAQIEADGSVFALVGKDARHGKLAGEQEGEKEWSVYKNIEESERMLGNVTYIDMEGNEREYWLESIYDEAMSIREAHCTAIRSAACALRHAAKNGIASPQNNQFAPQASPTPVMPAYNSDSIPEPPSMRAKMHGVNNLSQPSVSGQFSQPGLNPSQSTPPMQPAAEAMPKSREVNNVPKEQVAQAQPTQDKAPVKESSPPEQGKRPASEKRQKQAKEQSEEFESADSALPLMIVSLFSMFFSIVWFVFFKLPYRVCSTILTFCVVLMSLRILWLLLADDNGAWDMGAGVDYGYNAPGIY